MAVGDAIAGLQNLQSALEHNKNRKFELEKMLREEQFKAGESEKERANRLELEKLGISPAMTKIAEEKRVTARQEKYQEEQQAEAMKEKGYTPEARLNALGLGKGDVPTAQGIQNLVNFNNPHYMGILNGYMTSIKDPNEQDIYKEYVLNKSMQDYANVNREAARVEGSVNALRQNQDLVSMPVDMAGLMPQIHQAFEKVVPHWHPDTSLISFLSAEYGKNATSKKVELEDEVQKIIQATNAGNALGQDSAAAKASAIELVSKLDGQGGLQNWTIPTTQTTEATPFSTKLKSNIGEALSPIAAKLPFGLGWDALHAAGLVGPKTSTGETYENRSGFAGWKPLVARVSKSAYLSGGQSVATPVSQTLTSQTISPQTPGLFQPTPTNIQAAPSTPQSVQPTTAQPTNIDQMANQMITGQ